AAPGGDGGTEEVFNNDNADPHAFTIKMIRPKRIGETFMFSAPQPADVRPFERAELKARVAGTVKCVHKRIGNRVKKGEVLLELYVPDLDQEVKHKDALVHQAE